MIHSIHGTEGVGRAGHAWAQTISAVNVATKRRAQ